MSDVVKATFVFPNGEKKELDVPATVFKSGRAGFYLRLPKFQAQGKIYSGQVQIWEA